MRVLVTGGAGYVGRHVDDPAIAQAQSIIARRRRQ